MPSHSRSSAGRPNILLFTADDMDVATPGAFGGPHGLTPTIDSLAADGVAFERAHVPVAVCQPSRSALMTGRWPHRNGAMGFEPIADGVPVLTDALHSAGYLTGILGKVDHLQPVARFGWDLNVPMRQLGMGRAPAAYAAATREMVERAEEAGRPWFLMANAHDPHRPFHGSAHEAERFTAEERSTYPAPSRTVEPGAHEPPGFLPDLPDVRTEYAQYLASSRRCDDVLASVLGAIGEAACTTVVVFLSDNGMAFPFAKANCYLRSTLTPLVIRWPGVTAAGARERDVLVSTLDLYPTLCDMAGVDGNRAGLPDGDGSSLVPLLRGDAPPVARDEIVTVFHETAAKRRLEMRCVQDRAYGYIWNCWSEDGEEYQAENMEGLTWAALTAAGERDPELAARAEQYRFRRPEELYDLRADPECLTDLADDPAHRETLTAMRLRIARWMNDSGDPLAARYCRLADQRTHSGTSPPGGDR
ncbi:sulfatase [Georgenia alba]|uniref:Sulfatase n=1 Tax=Georgenia alba TaxID=2233858 RepID=A0ABW2Q5I2_9MICO